MIDDDNIMLAVPAADSFEYNVELNLYSSTSKKNEYGYIGLYKNKAISAVGKVIKVVKLEKQNDKINFDVPITEDEENRIKRLEFEKCRGASDPNYEFVPDKGRVVFFVDKFYKINYENVGKMGIMGSKKFFLDNLLPATTEEIAYQLDGQTWKLEKGKKNIPSRKIDDIF